MILKIFALLFVFVSTIFSKEVQTITVDESLKTLNAASYTLHFIDKNSSMTPKEIAKQKHKLFKQLDRSKYNFTQKSVWTWMQLHNPTNKLQNVVGENPWPGIDKIDIYIFKGNKQVAHFKRGDAHKQEYRDLLYGNSTFHAALQPQENLDIFVKYRSYGAIKTTFLLHSPQSFVKSALASSRMYAFFFGVLIALIIYNLSLYFSIKQKVFLYYCLYGVFNIILISTTNGYLYELDMGLYGDSISLIGTLAANFMVVSLLVMITSLFELKEHSRVLYYINMFIAFSFILFSIANVFTILDRQNFSFLTIIDNYILSYLYYIAMLTLAVDAIVGVYKKLPGSYFVFVGLAMYFVGAYVFLGYINGKFEYSFFANRANVFAVFADMIFISIALSQKVSILKKENEKNRLLIFQKSRFDTIGNTLSGVIHQLKTPLNYLGSQLTYLEAKSKVQGDKSDDETFTRLKSINKEINSILEDVYKLYKKEDKKTKFDIQKPIQHSLTLLSTQTIKNQIKVNIKSSGSIKMYGYPNTLSHVLIIIIENAIEIFKQRDIASPKLNIDYYRVNDTVTIKISDNAKGVDEKDLNYLFELYFSKRKGGTGIGLALAKKLVESKLEGTLFASNGNEGLNLHISLPYET